MTQLSESDNTPVFGFSLSKWLSKEMIKRKVFQKLEGVQIEICNEVPAANVFTRGVFVSAAPAFAAINKS